LAPFPHPHPHTLSTSLHVNLYDAPAMLTPAHTNRHYLHAHNLHTPQIPHTKLHIPLFLSSLVVPRAGACFVCHAAKAVPCPFLGGPTILRSQLTVRRHASVYPHTHPLPPSLHHPTSSPPHQMHTQPTYNSRFVIFSPSHLHLVALRTFCGGALTGLSTVCSCPGFGFRQDSRQRSFSSRLSCKPE